MPAHDSGVAVAGKRDRIALLCTGAYDARPDQFRLLGELRLRRCVAENSGKGKGRDAGNPEMRRFMASSPTADRGLLPVRKADPSILIDIISVGRLKPIVKV
jgi:hypothetical protein